jgi:hypothetical protein
VYTGVNSAKSVLKAPSPLRLCGVLKPQSMASSEGARVGRPSKLTKARTTRLVALVRQGCPVDSACALVGIHRDTFYAWLRRGRDAGDRRARGEQADATETAYLEFADALGAARAAAEADAVAVIWEATQRDWRAAAWFLEHAFPDRWGRQGRATVDVVHHVPFALEEQVRRGAAVREEAERRLALPASTTVAEATDTNEEGSDGQ